MAARNLVPCFLLFSVCFAAAQEKKSPLPGKATWDLRAFNVLFRVVGTVYDEGKKQVTWTLETKQGARTAEFVRDIEMDRPFLFTFIEEKGEGDMKEMMELAQVRIAPSKIQGIPKDKVMLPGTKLTLTLDVPDAATRANKVVLSRGKAD